jgi:hypothetical protein
LFRKPNKTDFFPQAGFCRRKVGSAGAYCVRGSRSFESVDREANRSLGEGAPAWKKPMRPESKQAVVQRLEFAAAELEVVSEIAKREGDPALLKQLQALTERMRDCISCVSNGNKSGLFLGNRDLTR